MYEKKKRNLGWFDTGAVSNRLRNEVGAAFYEKYYAHNEIDPFSGKPRVIGLVDANWIVDIGAGAIPGLAKAVLEWLLLRQLQPQRPKQQ